jgi:hypothetical protein
VTLSPTVFGSRPYHQYHFSPSLATRMASQPPAGSGVSAVTRMLSRVRWLAMSPIDEPIHHWDDL